MCLWKLKEGDFLYSSGKELIMASKSKRKRAKRLPCWKRPSLCCMCGVTRRIISIKLAARLQDPHFTLPDPLPRKKAKRWKAARPAKVYAHVIPQSQRKSMERIAKRSIGTKVPNGTRAIA